MIFAIIPYQLAIIVEVHCEELGGTGLASYKGCNSGLNSNCYSFATYHSNESILKAYERATTLSSVPTDVIIT